MTSYNVYHKGELLYEKLSEEEYFDVMQDLADKFYKSGSPDMNEFKTEMIEEF